MICSAAVGRHGGAAEAAMLRCWMAQMSHPPRTSYSSGRFACALQRSACAQCSAVQCAAFLDVRAGELCRCGVRTGQKQEEGGRRRAHTRTGAASACATMIQSSRRSKCVVPFSCIFFSILASSMPLYAFMLLFLPPCASAPAISSTYVTPGWHAPRRVSATAARQLIVPRRRIALQHA
jgi:hypothetical protein